MKIVLLILFFVFFAPSYLLGEQSYSIGIICIEGKNCNSKELESILVEMYARTGNSVHFQYLPPLRDLYYLNIGEIDSSSIRSLHGIEDYPNIIPIKTPLFSSSIVAFIVNNKIKVETVSDLYNVTAVVSRGDIISTTIAEEYALKTEYVNDRSAAIFMLTDKRSDVLLIDRAIGVALFHDLEIEIYYESPPLIQYNLYHVINKMHEDDLAEDLDEAIRGMRQDGTLDRLAGRYGRFLSPPLPDEEDQ